MNSALVLLSLVLPLFTSAALADDAPMPEISDFRYAGDGCPEGTAEGQLEANGNFGIRFDKLEAFTSAGEQNAMRQCEFSVLAQPAPGWKMSIRRVLLDGIYEISQGGAGRIATSYVMSGMGMEPFWARRAFQPGTSGDFNIDDGMDDWGWSGCGEAAEIAGIVELVVARGLDPASHSEIIVQNGVVDQKPRIVWEWVYMPCDGGDTDLGIEGAWVSTYQTETGQHVDALIRIDGDRGTYDIGSAVGELRGIRYEHGVAKGRWRLGQYTGWFQFRVDGERFDGQWGRGTNSRPGGRWWGERLH